MTMPAPVAPVIGVGVAVFRGERVLLVQRSTPPRRGSWSLPGGRVELGEALIAAAKREVREECAIDVEVEGPALILNRIVRDEAGAIRFHYVIVDFVARYADDGPEPVSGSDAQAVRWVHPSELPQLPLTPHLERYVAMLAAARDHRAPGCVLVEEV